MATQAEVADNGHGVDCGGVGGGFLWLSMGSPFFPSSPLPPFWLHHFTSLISTNV